MAKHPAAHIVILAEEGTRDDLVRDIARKWDEIVELRRRLATAEDANGVWRRENAELKLKLDMSETAVAECHAEIDRLENIIIDANKARVS
jgi:chromosome segregation ATPase